MYKLTFMSDHPYLAKILDISVASDEGSNSDQGKIKTREYLGQDQSKTLVTFASENERNR